MILSDNKIYSIGYIFYLLDRNACYMVKHEIEAI